MKEEFSETGCAMYTRRVWSATVLMSLIALAVPVAAAPQTIQIKGTVSSLNMGRGALLVQEPRPGDDRFWVVKHTTRTRILVGGRATTVRSLRVGNPVTVRGSLTGTREVLASQIVVTGPARKPAPPVILRPPVGEVQVPALGDILKITSPPEIIRPANGARVASTFTIVGRTAPSAQVRIDVVSRYLVFDLPGASADVTADGRGIFSHSVQPVARISGASYVITVKARFLGFESPSATVTVHQR